MMDREILDASTGATMDLVENRFSLMNSLKQPVDRYLDKYAQIDLKTVEMSPEDVAKINVELAAGLQALKESDVYESAGHDMNHITNALYTLVRMSLDPEIEFNPAQDLSAILAVAAHDVGRKYEDIPGLINLDMSKTQANQIRSTLEYMTPVLMARSMNLEKLIPEPIQQSIVYSLASAKQKETGVPMADVVHWCDREQHNGGVFPLRNIIAVVDGGFQMYPGVDANYGEKFGANLDTPESLEAVSSLYILEFYLRNGYPAPTKESESYRTRNRLEQAQALMLAVDGMGEDANEWIFGPEINPDSAENYGRFKQPIPEDIYHSARDNCQDFKARLEAASLPIPETVEGVVDLLLAAYQTEGFYVPEDMRQKFIDRFEPTMGPTQLRNLALITYNVLSNRAARLDEEIELVEQVLASDKTSAFIKTTAAFVHQEYLVRKQRYKDSKLVV